MYPVLRLAFSTARRRLLLTALLFLLSGGLSLSAQNDTLENGITALSRIGCVIDDNAIKITGTGSIHSNKASLPGETTLDELDLNFRVQVSALDTAGDVHFVIGKHGGIAGTMLEFIATDSTSVIKVDRMNLMTPVFITQFVLPFVLEAGNYYHIRVGKRARALLIEVVSSDSTQVFYNDSLSYPTPFFGCLWGKPFIACHTGTIFVRDFSITTPFSKSPRLLVMGDSFIEGNALPDADQRYIRLVQDSIGYQNVTISGKGGEASGTMTSRFYTELGWFSGARYAYVPVGVNDNNFTAWKNNMTAYLDTLKKLNLIPIIATLSPRSDRLPFIAAVNSWIRNDYNGAYIDVGKAISPAGTTWGTGLGMADSVHPTAAGHIKIYERMQLEAPYLFRTNDPYTIDYVNETTAEPVSAYHEYDVLTSFSGATAGSASSVAVVPGQTIYFRDTTDVPGINSIFHILVAPKRPAAPTATGIGGSGFDWTNNPSYTSVSDYEFSPDAGTTWTTCSSKPVYYPASGSILLRVRAKPGNFRSEPVMIIDVLTNAAAAVEMTLPDLLVFPNPVTDHLTVSNVFEPTLLAVYSVDGKLIREMVLEAETNSVGTEELSPGFYLFTMKNSRGQKSYKILKK